jgi:NTP pyrophosphatase (non-canonical NTP hydrolase)
MLHAAMGIATESGELLDALKKHLFYGGPLDIVNLIEEAGDLFYYTEILLDVLNIPTSEVRAKNKAKLEARYGGKFSSDRALNRNLEAENKALEE